MTEEQIKKVLRPKMTLLYVFLILLVISVGSYIWWYDRSGKLETPELVDFGSATNQELKEEDLYVDTTLIGIVPFAEEDDDKIYCFGIDDNYNLFLIKVDESTLDKMEQQYDTEGDDFKLSESNFELYVGSVMFDNTIHPQETLCLVLTCVGCISGFFAVLVFIVFMVGFITYLVCRSKQDLDLIRCELAGKNTKSYPKLGAYLTDRYIFAGWKLTAYYDIVWIYTVQHRVNGIPTNATLVGRTKDGKQVVLAGTKKINKLEPLAEEIYVRNSNMLVGYTAENIKKYKEIQNS